ncbi:aspartate aminotransferase family protein [Heliorestis convoluta]|uniref:Aminotransferase class III-fold pyridoxal phosphate-dependent enzyme n=1 Tax=Heliorestis convoluta TaxID=356322 RepID=A0A5Q2N1P3_9FIRM|nr:aminotransferase class III-fold pyridoxal phosphate-dependent enzyme [Heliorestis convoluta]QGG47753.1 aminotransferase class III-fold pyridoxal phosphate-dependent enzyme [Heliorestis convoluta]
MSSLLLQYEKNINPSMARIFRFMGLGTEAVRAEGSYVYDDQGNCYLDFLGNFGVFNLGHRHPRVLEAVRQQLEKLPQTTRYLVDRPTAELAALLAEVTPGDLQYSFFCNSGAEAVEGAIKLARLSTGKKGIISTFNSFHGKTMGALTVSGRELFRKPCEPLLPQVEHIAFGDIDALKKVIANHSDWAALVLEPIQGEGGVQVPPKGYLRQVEDICRNEGILLILDEVQTGLGRSGYFFVCEKEEVVPDILCLAKALGGGVMPIGAIVGRPTVWEPFLENPFIHTSTFGGNPLACAAALATIKVIIEEELVQQSREKGNKALTYLQQVAANHADVIVEVRGQGLLIGIELAHEGMGGYMINRMVEEKIIVGYTLNNSRVIRLEPPLNIAMEDLERALDRIATITKEMTDQREDFMESTQ